VKILHPHLFQSGFPNSVRRAFSLVEVLVVTGLLSVIIIGLVLMFSQTQRAYKLGTTQVDMLEGGRMVTDLMSRDLAQISPSQIPNFPLLNYSPNLYVGLFNYAPLYQPLPGTQVRRTNLMQELFFLTRENQTWKGIGYFVRTNSRQGYLGFPAGGGGALYRFETNYSDTLLRRYPDGPWLDFLAARTNEYQASRVLEGVVHFVVRAYDPSGYWIPTNHWPNIITNSPAGAVASYPFGETSFLYFYSNAVPASMEVELGTLESREIERARSISDATARANYLAQQAGKVHLFRWRVPVRNCDTTVYQ